MAQEQKCPHCGKPMSECNCKGYARDKQAKAKPKAKPKGKGGKK